MTKDECCICYQEKKLVKFFKNHKTCNHICCKSCRKKIKKIKIECPICRERSEKKSFMEFQNGVRTGLNLYYSNR
jgi:hypothetical protein